MGLITFFGRLRSDRSAARAFDALGPEVRGTLARDLGLSTGMLGRVVSRGGSAGRELPRLLRSVGLQPGDVRQRNPAVTRDMQAVCSTCEEWRRCRRDLERNVAQSTFESYCPNAQTISALGGRTWRSHS